jgi:hypothetical protein
MKILKIIGLLLLYLIAIPGALQLLIVVVSTLGSIAHQQDNYNISYAIGRLTGSLIVEVLVIVGIVKLTKSL